MQGWWLSQPWIDPRTRHLWSSTQAALEAESSRRNLVHLTWPFPRIDLPQGWATKWALTVTVTGLFHVREHRSKRVGPAYCSTFRYLRLVYVRDVEDPSSLQGAGVVNHVA